MLSGQKDKEVYSLSAEDKKRLKGLLNQRKTSGQKGGQGCEKGETPDALGDEIGIELMEYILEEDEQYLSSQNIAQHLDSDASHHQIGHRVRMIGDSLGLDRDEVGQFYSSSTTWDLDTLRENNLNALYEDARDLS